jgi:hypothetical protein
MRTRTVLTVLALGGLLLVAAAWGRPRQQQTQPPASPGQDKSMPGMPGMDMSHMDMGHDEQDHVESGAMHAMAHGHMEGSHMHMTSLRPAAPGDRERAEQIAASLRQAIEKYRDYRVALANGYRIFAPNVQQPEYHFTNYWNGFVEGFTFDPARPTSLLYKKTADGGWELIGAMYTAPRSATLDQLNDRIPLSVAQWHVHINLCVPKRGEVAHADWTKFGLTGSITTAQACEEAGGRFFPQIFGWMVHVYPFESSPEKMWEQ